MKVLLINTSQQTGGAAIATHRLLHALCGEGIDAQMLVRDKTADERRVIAVPRSWRLPFSFLWERLCVWKANGFSRRGLFDVDLANVGIDVTRLDAFRQADVVHINWINQGFLSLSGLRRIAVSGKPVVWTMHDMWPFTGICHYARTCTKYESCCHTCPALCRPAPSDLSATTFGKKAAALRDASITFVGCSEWLAQQARSSFLLRGKDVRSIPNAIDTAAYHPADKSAARAANGLPAGRKLVLFAAFKVTNKLKGLDCLIDAINRLVARLPQAGGQMGLVLAGQDAEGVAARVRVPVYTMGYVTDQRRMVSLYNAADLFAVPSVQDNLPNTIVEAMACGVPCIGFNVGGVPQMIDHGLNGYIARPADADDLSRGIESILFRQDLQKLSQAALAKAVATYSEHAVARQYIDIYNQLLSAKTDETR